MTVKPILFSGAMVRALLEGRKTQTRRVLNSQPAPWRDFHLEGGCQQSDWGFDVGFHPDDRGHPRFGLAMHSAFHETRVQWLSFAPADLLYVREAWRVSADLDELSPADLLPMVSVRYEADGALNPGGLPILNPGRLRQGMHQLRHHSRLTLRVTEVRVQRLQEISEEDAKAEGVEHDTDGWFDYELPDVQRCGTARDSFRTLWDSLNAKRGFGWDVNPWVTAVSFDVIRENVDAVLAREVA